MTHLTTATDLLIIRLKQLFGSELGLEVLIGGCKKLLMPKPVSADFARPVTDKISGSRSGLSLLLMLGDI
jgi:hypothetical protein